LIRPRAAIVVTGSELVRGDRTDLNGPFYAREALSHGLQPARVTIVGDDIGELEAAIREGMEADVCLISGGLGPTHDDRTVEAVARSAGRPLIVDSALEQQIESISRAAAERLGRPYADFADGVTKQATLPEGAISLGLAGTAPGIVLETETCVTVVLPGPPGELQKLWPRALETEPMQRVLARTQQPERRVLRFFGASESAIARALAEAGGDGDGVVATICSRDFEIHVDLIVEPGAEGRAEALTARMRAPVERYLFSERERSIQEIVLELCGERGLSLGTAESCTGGLVAAHLTAVPGSSNVFEGGIVAYGNEVKAGQLGVPQELLEEHGAVSAEAARAMAYGACEHLGVDVAVAVTGIAGPDGGTVDKPVGLVFFHAVGPEGEEALRFQLPGDRTMIRSRSAVAALHVVRRLLERSRHEGV
jgi:nicotinamide-nucleotide amidase